MIKNIAYVILLTCLTACGQTNNKKTLKKTHNEQDLLNLYKTVKDFEEEPHYGIYIYPSNTNFEIRVNDRIVLMNYNMVTNQSSHKFYFPLNTVINKSGLQTLEVRMYPCWNRQTEQLEPKLKNAQVEISIVKRNYNYPIDEEFLYTWKAPIKTDSTLKRFMYPERLEYIHKDTFSAKVPYEITTLDSAIDFSTTDRLQIAKLTKRLLPYYHKLKKILEKNQLNDYSTLMYKREKRIAQQLYFSKMDFEKRWNKDILGGNRNLVTDDETMQPLENYKLNFYANGKLLSLVSTNLELTGLNKSALYSTGKTRISRFPVLFYMPKGGTEFLPF